MTVRSAGPDDVDEIAALELEAFPDDAWTPAYLQVAIEGKMPTVRILVAEDDAGTVVGHALVSVVYEIAELQRIATAEQQRRRGIGGSLLTASIDLARSEGAERLLLEVRENNVAALEFYHQAGFIEIDRRERYYRDGATGIVLAMDLPGSAASSG
ncbi:ribosomal protein S18-alanine N-acetyltransferase [Nocardioides albus]|uniref:[Ribosomal protein bS18]-alanine N-acetyltransferase n=1 Tax=Nocardioides albus TaxID=1841 RepID=A0A7W5F751_9ACTN|nr:ribosomal protein S18-alanine N-acetyltransferase [Nocardioides albus]MBB3087477.1 ribosomal-protein-alanine N-acetyltransferase [Nocardioides albus]GGU09295.1 N-acetyltransferase [Nocardioides albus]